MARELHHRGHGRRLLTASTEADQMTTHEEGAPSARDPLAEIEWQLITAYLAGAGHELRALLSRHDDDARQLLAEASRYASARLSEIDARAHYMHTLHGEP